MAEEVDLIEPVAKFTDHLQGKEGIRNIFNVGLEEWQPLEDVRYDLIWTQWCLNYLTDEQVVSYLEVCKKVLTPDSGWIIIKENLSSSDTAMFDETDNSVTR